MEWLSVVAWVVGTAVVLLGPLILVHELGHFVAAKLSGVRVEEFGIGFPPRLVRLGRERGFVRVNGVRMRIVKGSQLPFNPVVGTRVEAIAAPQPDGQYVLVKMRILDSSQAAPDLRLQPLTEQLLSSVKAGTSDGDLSLEKWVGQSVPSAWVLSRGELEEYEPGTLYTLNVLPFGAFVRLTGEEDPTDPHSLAAQPKRRRIAVLAAGPVLNLLVAFAVLVAGYASGIPTKWQVRVAEVVSGSAAEQAGLQPGDIITAVENIPLTEGTEQLRAIVIRSPEKELSLAVRRGSRSLVIRATPRRDEEGNGLLGIIMDVWPDRDGARYYSLLEAAGASFRDLGTMVLALIRLPVLLLGGRVAPADVRPSSVVGISGLLTFALQRSLAWGFAFPALQTAAVISLALGLTNLLPLPALDGGRIFFVLLEAIRGRRIAPEREAAVHFVMFLILVGLMLLLVVGDILNPIIPWSWLK